MKKSIRIQIAGLFIALVCAILIVSIVINSRFLEGFYIQHKQGNLVDVYEKINETSLDDMLLNEEVREEFTELVEDENLDFVIIDYVNERTYTTSSHERKTEEMFENLMRYMTEPNPRGRETLTKTEQYEICSMEDMADGDEFLEMWGYLDNGNPFFIRSPLDSIQESAALANEFLTFTSFFMIILGSIVVWIFSKHITNPILELTTLSKRMANLEFDAKYTSGGKNEIGVLGMNFNTMSEKLEQTISELKTANYELKKDIEKKEKIDLMRTEFVGNVSHELKTPIALIQGYAEGLKEGISDKPEDRDYYCEVIMDEANKMNQLVRNLLTLNQLEVGNEAIAFERFNIVDLIEGVVQSNDILIKQKEANVEVKNTDPVYVWADEFKAEQVLRNYLNNALNHVDDEKRIEIRIEKRDEADKARITVFNSGKPIPEEDIEHIWNKFYKVDKAHTREYGGNGIGLSIVKAIMESFQNAYGVENHEDGVSFWFELDLK